MFNGCEIVEQNSVSGQGFFALLRITVLDKNESYQTFCGSNLIGFVLDIKTLS